MIRLFTIINVVDGIPSEFSTGATSIAYGQISLDGNEQIISGDFNSMPNTTAIENAGYTILTEEEARLQACEWDEEV